MIGYKFLMNALVSFILVLSLAVVSLKGQSELTLGSYCTKDINCEGGGLVCKMFHPNCTFGECRCPKDHAFDEAASTCKAVAWLGLPCDEDSICYQPYSECKDGRCQCADGYAKRFAPDKIRLICEKQTAIKGYNRTCFDDSECKTPFLCSSKTQTCQCDVGLSYTGYNKRFCVPKSINDSCERDNECAIANGICGEDGKCKCASQGYKSIPWKVQFRDPVSGDYTGWTIYACVGKVEPTYEPGAVCRVNLKRSRSLACNSDSLCIPCNPNHNTTGFCIDMTHPVGQIGGFG